MRDYFDSYLRGTAAALEGAREIASEIERAADRMIDCLRAGGTVFFAGNGGSASDAQHLAAELLGRFRLNRDPLRSICLNTDTSIITAVANDFGYDLVIARQVKALARAGDVVVLISTSGESTNVLVAADAAKTVGATVVGLTGPATSTLAKRSDIALAVGPHPTCHIQEAHITIGQALCGFIEDAMFDTAG